METTSPPSPRCARRYSRLKEENKELPELIVIDGGAGQLSSALKGAAGDEG